MPTLGPSLSGQSHPPLLVQETELKPRNTWGNKFNDSKKKKSKQIRYYFHWESEDPEKNAWFNIWKVDTEG